MSVPSVIVFVIAAISVASEPKDRCSLMMAAGPRIGEETWCVVVRSSARSMLGSCCTKVEDISDCAVTYEDGLANEPRMATLVFASREV